MTYTLYKFLVSSGSKNYGLLKPNKTASRLYVSGSVFVSEISFPIYMASIECPIKHQLLS